MVGLGKSGFAAAKFLNARKAVVRVTEGSEKKEALENAGYLRTLGIEVETGGHTEDFLSGADWVVTSPGVPKNSAPLVWARQKKIPVISEVELASYFCKGRIVAVTGSNGKTTTCHLIYRILTDAGRHCILCGNVGYSFLEATHEITRKTIVVLELSSFQLEDSPHFRPKIAVVLNLSANHLDRHGTLEDYARAKENIFKNQRGRDTLVLNADDLRVKAMAARAQGRVVFFSKSSANGWMRPATGAFHLKGAHNLENILAGAAVAQALGVPKKKMQRTLENFRTLEHRIEPVGELRGVRFVNDSKSTTVQSTRAAIETVDGPVVLLAGGRDKAMPFSELEPVLAGRVKAVVLYGEARDKIAASWTHYRPVKKEQEFEAAVRLAFREAGPGDCVLLSPMCSSFDQFTSFEQRGEAFKEIFRRLSGEREGAECRP